MPVEIGGTGNRTELASEPLGRVVIEGANCTLRVGRNVRLEASIRIDADVSNAVIEIGDGCHIAGMIRLVRGDGGVIRIGEGTSFNAVGVSMHEAGEITFGRDCMLSTDIHMDVSDMHPIFDRTTGLRINPAQNIALGDHVWIGTRVRLLKGANIGTGAIIGAGAMVAGTIPEHCLAVGSPAKVVRENVVWMREFGQTPKVVPPAPPQAKPRGWGWLRSPGRSAK